jgi:probable rRNA maturation factor
MPRTSIHFFEEDISYNLKQKIKIRKWITQTISNEGKTLQELNFIFCSDDYLLKINREYLKHDTFTDIITFDNSEDSAQINGDIFISIDRIRDNAKDFKVSESNELHRVMIHGTLHLLGYRDKTKQEKSVMTEKEDKYLSVRNF